MTLAACADLVRRGDPDRFLATMAGPTAARACLFPLYAFNLEVARAPWTSQEPLIGEMRLQWWYDVLGQIAAGERAAEHEVVAPLAQVIGETALPVEPLQALVDARRRDVERVPFATSEAFDAYLDATGGTLMWSAARTLGAPPEHETAIRDAGWAAALAGWFRAIPELEARGRQPLADGRPAAIAALAREGLTRLERAHRAPMARPALPALWAGWRSRAVLERVAAQPGAVADGALESSEFARRFGLVWRSVAKRW